MSKALFYNGYYVMDVEHTNMYDVYIQASKLVQFVQLMLGKISVNNFCDHFYCHLPSLMVGPTCTKV